MRWGRAFVVVVVALVGAQFIGLALPAKAVFSPPPPKLYEYTYNHTNGALGGPGVTDSVTGIRAGNIAVVQTGDTKHGGLPSYVLLDGEDIGGYRVVREGSGAAFAPFGTDWTGGVTIASGDLSGSSIDQVVTGQETGGSLVRVFPWNADPNTQPVASFQAYEDGFKGGVRVAVGDVNGDGTPEIIVAPGPGRAPTVKVFSPSGTLLASADVFASSFTGGVYVAAANLDSDAAGEIIVGAGAGGGPNVKVFKGLNFTTGANFFAFDPADANGVRVAGGTLDGQQVIVATTRADDGGFVRLFNPDASAATTATAVSASDGDLAPAVDPSEGHLFLFDAAPRLAGVNPEQLHPHTRSVVTLYGAGLTDLFDDITIGDQAHPAAINGVIDDGQDLQVEILLPAATPAGPLPITLSVKTPGGTQTHNLHSNALSVVGGAPLDAFVTTGVGSGGGPHVRTYSAAKGLSSGFMGGDTSRSSGVRVARADLDGNGHDDYVVSYGPGTAPTVSIYDSSQNLVSSFDAYDDSFLGGVYVAAGDLDGDGVPEIVTAADAGGGPHVKVFDLDGNELAGFMAYDPNFHGGVRVAVGDVDGDGFADIITAPGPGGGPHVRAFTPDGQVLGEFMAYDPRFTGGVFVATSDVDGDGVDEIVTGPGAGGGPHVRVFLPDGSEVAGFMAFDPNFTGGVSVGRVGDDIVGPDRIAVGAGPGGGPHVKIFDGDGGYLDGYMAYDPNFHGGVFVAGGIA